jgi:alkylation response protein AidB-like acyl-CoA dehydrogenase
VKDGEEWIVNGQKVWNTLAHLGDWGMLVARTDPEAPKHKGMTYFALDMRLPGVEVRPLRQITGEAEFNEVYMTDARVPDDCRIGAIGEGWRAALTTLMNERTAIGGGSGGGRRTGPIAEALRIWDTLPADERTGARRERLMQLFTQSEAFRLTNVRAGQKARSGNPGPEGSIAKLALSNFNKVCTEFCIDLLGANGLVDYDYTFRRPEALSVDGMDHGIRHSFLRARANSIEGGTTEIMKNILGEQMLGLPGEPRVDKELPWSKVPRS